MNGVVNVSVLDGWWDEGWTGDNGWAIGGRETNPDEGAQDWADAQDLYRILEKEIVPVYYERDADGLPQRWLQLMRNSIASTIWRFSTTRMLHEYVEQLYLPAAAADDDAEDAARGRHPLIAPDPPRRHPQPRPKGAHVAPRISLALAIHNHQPVGNFGWVFAEVYDQAYLPMVEALERHPGVRLSLHYTGPLLEWLAAERPDFLERLRALVARGQVEILGGGLYEPVLASLPERDRIGQLTRMAEEVEGSPAGARAARGWPSASGSRTCRRPGRPRATAGRSSTTSTSGRPSIPEANLWGAYTTEDQGRLLTVFGTEQGLRYRIPFGDGRGGHRLPARPRDRGRRPRRDDGRRRREVRRLADDVRALLGPRPLGRAVLRGARGERATG